MDSSLHGDLLGIVNSVVEAIQLSFPNGSFARLYLGGAIACTSAKDPRQMRWHPVDNTMVC